jgi:hypothetical protein
VGCRLARDRSRAPRPLCGSEVDEQHTPPRPAPRSTCRRPLRSARPTPASTRTLRHRGRRSLRQVARRPAQLGRSHPQRAHPAPRPFVARTSLSQLEPPQSAFAHIEPVSRSAASTAA